MLNYAKSSGNGKDVDYMRFGTAVSVATVEECCATRREGYAQKDPALCAE